MEIDNEIIPCHWQVTFYIKPSLKESETIELYDPVECESRPFEFQVIGKGNGKKTQVTIDYKTNKFDEVSPDSKSEYEYAEETKARKYELFIQNLMLERMIYQRVFSHLEVEKVKYLDDTDGSLLKRSRMKAILRYVAASIAKYVDSPGNTENPRLLNKKELANAGLSKKHPVISDSTLKWNELDVGDSLTESHNDFWQSGFQNTSRGYENDALRIADWLQRSEGENDEINSFIFAWIAFNGLYGLFASITGFASNTGKPPNDAEKFEHIIKKLLVNEASNIGNSSALSKLESYGILSNNGNRNWSDELKNERRNIYKDDIKVLQYAMRCVYGVRKEVFHEAPQPVDIIERAKTCKSILIPVAVTCLKNFVKY